jgi:hypothetical protein
MAYSVNQAPPLAQTSWTTFDAGDSANILSETRVGAFYEQLQKLTDYIREFNASNILQLPQVESTIDADAGELTGSLSIPFQVIVDAATGEQTKKAVNYLTSVVTYTAATTGELKSIDNPYDSLVYMARQIARMLDVIRPGRLINDARSLLTLVADESAGEYNLSFVFPMGSGYNAAGTPVHKPQEIGAIADLQNA